MVDAAGGTEYGPGNHHGSVGHQEDGPCSCCGVSPSPSDSQVLPELLMKLRASSVASEAPPGKLGATAQGTLTRKAVDIA